MIDQVKEKVSAHVKGFYTAQSCVATGHGFNYTSFYLLNAPARLVKLMKGHFTHFKLGCFFMTIPFLFLYPSHCFWSKFPSSPWDAARLLFRFLLNPSKRFLFRVPFQPIRKNNRCCRFCERKPERLSEGDWDGTERLPERTNWVGETPAGMVFPELLGLGQASVADGYLDPTVDPWMTRFKLSTCSRASQ